MESTGVEARLTAIETRLSKIEHRFKTSDDIFGDDFDDVRVAPPKASDSFVRPSVERAAEEEKPGNWLGIIAVICFVLAAGFIIKLSIESGWLTPVRQIGIAALLGFGLIGSGLGLLKSDRAYASFLPGAGVIVLYLTAFAAHRLYGLVSFEAALLLTAAISGLCIFLYAKIKHDIYPITATIGTYIAPALLGLHAEAVFSLYYYAACSLAFATISVWVQSRTLILISAYLAIMMTALVGFDLHQDAVVAVFLGLHFVVFAGGTYFYTHQSGRPLTEAEAWCFLPVLLVFYALEYTFIDRIHPGLAPWISLGFAGVLFGLYLLAKRFLAAQLGSQSLIFAFVALVGFHSVYLELLPEHLRPWLFVVITLGAAFAPLPLASFKGSRALVVPALTLLAIVGIEYLSMLAYLLRENTFTFERMAVSFAALASLWVVIATSKGAFRSTETGGEILLGCAHLLAIVGLYRLTSDIGSLAVSASWLFYGAGVIAFSFTRKDEIMAKSAVFVLGFAAGKALLYDAASAPTIIRILCLLLTGAVLYAGGFFIRQTSAWKK